MNAFSVGASESDDRFFSPRTAGCCTPIVIIILPVSRYCRLLKSSTPAAGGDALAGQARLEAIEEEETVRMHLAALKREEVALQVCRSLFPAFFRSVSLPNLHAVRCAAADAEKVALCSLSKIVYCSVSCAMHTFVA